MAESIEQLRIYKSARTTEDRIYELVKQFPADQYYALGNDLRRSSAAVSHHIMEAHRLFSYHLKLDELTQMRREAELTQKYLDKSRAIGATEELILEYTSLIKQSWALSRWLRTRLIEKREKAEIIAKEQMAESLAS